MRAAPDVVTIAAGLVALAVSAFFLFADEPSLHDVGRVLVPVGLVVAGVTMLLGATGRASRRPR